jgi:arginine-tRNA-protein transferase
MSTVKFGLSTTFQCGYLPEREERLLVYIDEMPMSESIYTALQAQGFRRSESFVYRPHCQNCSACQSIRIPVHNFVPSKSQKRVLNKATPFSIKFSNKEKNSYYALFERYINEKHKNGVMYPADKSQLKSFTQCEWVEKVFIELYDEDKLIAVAICDVTLDSLSAVYTFYDPNYMTYSIGTLMILQQINLTKSIEKTWLYLGYYIQDCDKMNYKNKFTPYQIRKDDQWITHK